MSTFAFCDYLAEDRLPHMWCPGCGDGIILRAYTEALAELGLPPNNVVTFTGSDAGARLTIMLKPMLFTAHMAERWPMPRESNWETRN